MEWQDQGIIIGAKPHGETGLIIELITREHGRHKGIVKGGRSKRQMPFMQPGNFVAAHWQARLAEHIGLYRLETENLAAALLMQESRSLYALQTVSDYLRLLPERDPCPELYEILPLLLTHFDTPLLAGEIFMRFELRLLEELGFGLDLSRCAATGKRGAAPGAVPAITPDIAAEGISAAGSLRQDRSAASGRTGAADEAGRVQLSPQLNPNSVSAAQAESAEQKAKASLKADENAVELAYVSPRTGRAVGREAGAPWRDKLLPLPPFLLDTACRAEGFGDLAAAARLTGFFLTRNVFEPRGLTPPPFRDVFLSVLAAAIDKNEAA